MGDLCYEAARARLDFALRQRLDDRPHEQGGVWLKVPMKDLQTWRKERSDKALYELQIEACDMALQALKRERKVSSARRKEIEDELRKERDTLQRTKKAYFFELNRDRYEMYNAKKAQKIREQYEEEKRDKLR